MRRYVIVQLLEPCERVSFARSDWPLHVTLVPNFALDWTLPTLQNELSALLAHRSRVTTTAESDAIFGPERTVPVTLLETTASLVSFHRDIHHLLVNAGAVFENPAYAGDGYRPHVTVQRHRRLERGEEVVIDAASIIDLDPDGDPTRRRILGTLPIPGRQPSEPLKVLEGPA